MQVKCSHCGKSLRVPDDAAGKNGKCPACKKVFRLSPAPVAPAKAKTARVGKSAVTTVTEYRLKKGLLNRALAAHYECPNRGCRADLKSEVSAIGRDETCPNCGTAFQLSMEPLQHMILSQNEKREAREQQRLEAKEAALGKRETKKREQQEERERRDQERLAREKRVAEELREQDRIRIDEEEKRTQQLTEEERDEKTGSGGGLFRKCMIVLAASILFAGTYALLSGSKASLNPLQSVANTKLQGKIDQTIAFDQRNRGISVSAYYKTALGKDVVVFDLEDIEGSKSRLDVFRVLLDFAEEMEDESFSSLELAFRGDTRFILDGSYVRTLGSERRTQNPSYTIRTFPENLKTPYGSQAYSEWSGGLIGVLQKQMEDFNDVHDKWYLDDL